MKTDMPICLCLLGNSKYGVTGVSVDVSETVKPTPGGQTGRDESK